MKFSAAPDLFSIEAMGHIRDHHPRRVRTALLQLGSISGAERSTDERKEEHR